MKPGCFPSNPPISPLRLASNYRDYPGDPHAFLAALVDPIINAACYVPRIFHAPDTQAENLGVAPLDYLEYVLAIPPGSFILGYLHTYTSLGSLNDTDPPVQSGFKFQIEDVERRYRFFEKPIPEAFLLNDAPSSNPQSVMGAGLYVLNPSVRLLMAPYPVAPPGMFKIEFWNTLNQLNTNIRLSLMVAVPNPDMEDSPL